MSNPTPERDKQQTEPCEGVRLAAKPMSDEEWISAWDGKTQEIPDRANPNAYLEGRSTAYYSGLITAEEWREDLTSYMSHPDDTMAIHVMNEPQTIFQSYMVRKGLLDRKTLHWLEGDDMEDQANLWERAVERVKADMDKEGVALTPLGAHLMRAVQSATFMFIPEEPPPAAKIRRWGETRPKVLDAARQAGEEIWPLYEKFAQWCRRGADNTFFAGLRKVNGGTVLRRIALEHTEHINEIIEPMGPGQRPFLGEAPGKGRKPTLAVPAGTMACFSPEGVTALFQNLNTKPETLRNMVKWSLQEPDKAKPGIEMIHNGPNGAQMLFEYTRAGMTIDAETTEALKKRIRASVRQTTPSSDYTVANAALLPQACDDEEIAGLILKHGNEEALIRMVTTARSNAWIKAAMALSEMGGPRRLVDQAAQAVLERAKNPGADLERGDFLELVGARDPQIRAAGLEAIKAVGERAKEAEKQKGIKL